MLDFIREAIRRALAVEPALLISTISGALLIAVNLGLPAVNIDVAGSVTLIFNLLTILATVLGVRQSVYSPATHEQEVSEAFAEAQG